MEPFKIGFGFPCLLLGGRRFSFFLGVLKWDTPGYYLWSHAIFHQEIFGISGRKANFWKPWITLPSPLPKTTLSRSTLSKKTCHTNCLFRNPQKNSIENCIAEKRVLDARAFPALFQFKISISFLP
jgi:hypothetical protein